MKKSHLFGAVFAGIIISVLVGTPVFSSTVFPGELQPYIDAGIIHPTLVQQTPTFNAYTYSDPSGVDKYLFEYKLGAASSESMSLPFPSMVMTFQP